MQSVLFITATVLFLTSIVLIMVYVPLFWIVLSVSTVVCCLILTAIYISIKEYLTQK
jgi:hypothetical protein